MASSYSTNLAIELIGTGDQAGTWGVTTNTNLGTLIEQAISGYVTQAVSTGGDTTITIPNGATGVARNMYIELTGTGGAATNLIVPANKKLYFIFNNTASGQVTVKVAGETGVSVPNKAKMILVSNGTDIVDATNFVGTLSATSLTVSSDALISGLTVGKGAGAVSSNTAVGASALAANTSGSQSVAVGNNALAAQTTGFNNIAIGHNAGDATTTGASNIAIGVNANGSNVSGGANVAVGTSALANNTGSNNNAMGSSALTANTSGSFNTAIGDNALAANTTANDNVAVGQSALDANTTGANNVAVGRDALGANTTASNNTAVGYQALYANTTGAANVAVGTSALDANTTGARNTAIGDNALGAVTTADNNVGVGRSAGLALTTGNNNTFVGAYNGSTGGSGELITTGSKNTILGSYNGNQGGLDIRTASNAIVLSDGDGNPWIYNLGATTAFTSNTANSFVTAMYSTDDSGDVYFADFRSGYLSSGSPGTQRGYIYYNGSAVVYSTSSDQRLKENIVDAPSAITDLTSIKIRSFDWKENGVHQKYGVIAQELQTVAPNAISKPPGDDGMLGVDHSLLVPMMIKAIQELKAEFDAYKETHP